MFILFFNFKFSFNLDLSNQIHFRLDDDLIFQKLYFQLRRNSFTSRVIRSFISDEMKYYFIALDVDRVNSRCTLKYSVN